MGGAPPCFEEVDVGGALGILFRLLEWGLLSVEFGEYVIHSLRPASAFVLECLFGEVNESFIVGLQCALFVGKRGPPCADTDEINARAIVRGESFFALRVAQVGG